MGKHVTATQKVTGTTPEIVVHSRHVEISTRFREHVFDKLSRVDRFGVVIMGVDVEVGHEQNPRLADQAYEVELTCRGRGMVIRAEAHAADKWAALDQACERLEERLRRAADRRHDRQHGKGRAARRGLAGDPTLNGQGADLSSLLQGHDSDDVSAVEDHDVEELPPGVVHRQGPVEVREKEHVSAPMTVAEAVDALELVDHDFYLFHDIEADAPSVVYRRRGFHYGVIRLKMSSAEPPEQWEGPAA
jgi:ribosomal subunit interface protein